MIIVKKGVAIQRGIGKPDYSREISRGIQVGGYRLQYGEVPLWFVVQCVTTPGPSFCTRGPLLPGETTNVLVAPTGASKAVIPAGYDVLVKEFWLNFDQDVYFEVYEGGTYDDIACLDTIAAGEKPVNVLQQGWRRSILEDISVESIWRITVKNLGAENAHGKCWVLCLMKEGIYEWL